MKALPVQYIYPERNDNKVPCVRLSKNLVGSAGKLKETTLDVTTYISTQRRYRQVALGYGDKSTIKENTHSPGPQEYNPSYNTIASETRAKVLAKGACVNFGYHYNDKRVEK